MHVHVVLSDKSASALEIETSFFFVLSGLAFEPGRVGQVRYLFFKEYLELVVTFSQESWTLPYPCVVCGDLHTWWG